MKSKKEESVISTAEGLLESIEARLHAEAQARRQNIHDEREQLLVDSGIIATAEEAAKALPLIEKVIKDASPFFQSARRLRVGLFKVLSASATERNEIKFALDEFNMISGTPSTLRDGLKQLEELQPEGRIGF